MAHTVLPLRPKPRVAAQQAHLTPGSCDSFCSQRHSTSTRKRMRPYSEKVLRRPATLLP